MAVFPHIKSLSLWWAPEVSLISTVEAMQPSLHVLVQPIRRNHLNVFFSQPVCPTRHALSFDKCKEKVRKRFSHFLFLAPQYSTHPLTVLSRMEAMMQDEGLVRPHNYYSLWLCCVTPLCTGAVSPVLLRIKECPIWQYLQIEPS